MTTSHSPDRPRRARLPRLAAALVAVAVVVLPACTDAHTAEEKAWVDDGTDPRMVTVLVPSRMEERLKPVFDSQDELRDIRLVVVPVDEADAASRIDANPGPSVWIGDPDLFDAQPPPDIDVDDRFTLVYDVMAVVWYTPGDLTRPELGEFASPDGRPYALCAVDLPCGAGAEAIFRRMGAEPDPVEVYDDPDALSADVGAGHVKSTLTYTTYGRVLFPFGDTAPLEGEDAHPQPVEVRVFRSTEQAEAIAQWLAEAETREAVGTALDIPEVGWRAAIETAS